MIIIVRELAYTFLHRNRRGISIPQKKYRVTFTEDEKKVPHEIINKRQQFVEERFQSALEGKLRGHRPRCTLRLFEDARERDENQPLVCMDECPKQLIGETRNPMLAKPGSPACFEYF